MSYYETIGGKCPCCGHDKMYQDFSSHGYNSEYCPKCDFGFGENRCTFGEIETYNAQDLRTYHFEQFGKLQYNDVIEKLEAEGRDVETCLPMEQRKFLLRKADEIGSFGGTKGTLWIYSEDEIKNHLKKATIIENYE